MRTTPQSVESEKHLIGATLLDKHIPQGAREVVAADFVTPQYRQAWSAFVELDSAGREIDHISAHEIIKRNDAALSSWFTAAELVSTTVGMVHGINERVFVKAIKEASLKRYLSAELAAQIKALETDDGEQIITNLKRKIEELGGVAAVTGRFQSLSDIIEQEVKPALEMLHQGETAKISTGWPKVDTMIGGGLSLSDVLLVAGLPGSGKSAFSLQLAVNIAKQNIPVAFLSGEMSNRENAMRLLSQESRYGNLNSIMHLTLEDRDLLLKWAEYVKSFPLYFDSKTYDLQTVGRSMRSLVDNYGAKVLVIDYIQLLKMNRFDKQSRYERITEASQEVKRIAMEYGIAIIEVAQFNREGAKSGKPMMHDLEGSSQLEKDTSLIFILDRDQQSADITLRIEKGRNSGLGSIPGRFIGHLLTFEF